MAIELPITSATLTSPMVINIWRDTVSGRIEKLVLDPCQVAPEDWASLLFFVQAYHVPIELAVKDESPAVPVAVGAKALEVNGLFWGESWWEVRHWGVEMPISPRVAWTLRALSQGAIDAPMQVDDVNRQLRLWGQPPLNESNFRGIVRAIRARLPGHLHTMTRRGYLWLPCVYEEIASTAPAGVGSRERWQRMGMRRGSPNYGPREPRGRH